MLTTWEKRKRKDFTLEDSLVGQERARVGAERPVWRLLRSIRQGMCAWVLSHFSHVWLFATLRTATFSVHGILQTKMLELPCITMWVAVPSSRGSSWSRDQTFVSYTSCIGRQVLLHYCHQGSPSQGMLFPKSAWWKSVERNVCWHFFVDLKPQQECQMALAEGLREREKLRTLSEWLTCPTGERWCHFSRREDWRKAKRTLFLVGGAYSRKKCY